MWLARSSLMLTSSRSRHSAHLSQASESACQPDCPSRSDARRDASLHSCARFRQSATLIIAFTPPNALYRNLTQNGSPFNSSKRQKATLSPPEKNPPIIIPSPRAAYSESNMRGCFVKISEPSSVTRTMSPIEAPAAPLTKRFGCISNNMPGFKMNGSDGIFAVGS